MANIFSKAGKWVSDRLGLTPPKVTMPTLDQQKAGINDELAGWSRDLLSQYRNWQGYGTGPGGVPQYFGYRPLAGNKQVNPAVQQALAQLTGQGNTGTNAYVQSGAFLGSGGYDPTAKALAYEQATRGMDTMMDDDLRGLTEMFGKRGLANSSAAMGKAARVRGDYADRKGNIIGDIIMRDMDLAEKYRVADIDRLNQIDQLNYGVMQDAIQRAMAAASGSPYTPASLAEYEQSAAKRSAWDNKWSNIIGMAGDLGSAYATGGSSTAFKGAKAKAGGRMGR